MKIYTRTGDRGETGLFGGPRVKKSDPRVAAYGEVDELNAAIGAARAGIADAEIAEQLARIQDELFCVGAELATPQGTKARSAIPPVGAAWATRLEEAVDRWDAELPKLAQFVLPGGTPAAASLHLARCVCRRAERQVVALAAQAEVDPAALAYLNRLSDFLFTAARLANHRAGRAETPWDPGKVR
ncbi:MAG TPA: cob(I)yrinic acid a,c-diamide adenosyltransferase [Anaeromyxobacteraceae bacterium]|nr:cob(I)yrinic acid a,c-diamide adenosyltransferase [Anaeromyxobacteraceae bacterium]